MVKILPVQLQAAQCDDTNLLIGMSAGSELMGVLKCSCYIVLPATWEKQGFPRGSSQSFYPLIFPIPFINRVRASASTIPDSAAFSANAAYYLQGEAIGVRKLAPAFKKRREKQWFWAVFKSGSLLPHSNAPCGRKKHAALAVPEAEGFDDFDRG